MKERGGEEKKTFRFNLNQTGIYHFDGIILASFENVYDKVPLEIELHSKSSKLDLKT